MMKKIIYILLFFIAFVSPKTSDAQIINSYAYKATSEGYNPSDIFAYYRFNNNANDEKGTYNGTATSMTYTTGKSGQAAVYDGTNTPSITVADNDIFSFTNGTIDLGKSISMYVNFQTLDECFLASKRTSGDREWQILYLGGVLTFTIYDFSSSSSKYIKIDYTWTPSTSTWYHLTFTYSGSATASGLKMYVDALPVGTTSVTGGYTRGKNNTSLVSFGNPDFLSSYTLNGYQEGVAFWNKELSQAEVTAIRDKQNAGQELI